MSAPESLVVDASALVDLLVGTDRAPAVADRLRGRTWSTAAHCDAEVLSALGRLRRAEHLVDDDVENALGRLAAAPMARHPLVDLLPGAWAYRSRVRLVDALYIALGDRLDVPVVTTDQRLARTCARAEVVVI